MARLTATEDLAAQRRLFLPAIYLVGQAGLPVGTQALSGMFQSLARLPIIIPPGTFKFVLYNGAGVALASSGNTISYRTYNRQVA